MLGADESKKVLRGAAGHSELAFGEATPDLGISERAQDVTMNAGRDLTRDTGRCDDPGPRLQLNAGERLGKRRNVRQLRHQPAAADRERLEGAASGLARDTGCIVLFKGPDSLITDGSRQAHNETGNPGMATAGTGDVLTGVITALLGQGLGPYEAARLGAWGHGAAGDAAAQTFGQLSLTAERVTESLFIGCVGREQG